MMSYILLCPICESPLSEAGGLFRCENNHTFDRAREGYVNLLIKTGQNQPGDDKAMINARQSFLGAGYYQPLSDKLNELACENLSKKDLFSGHVVDAGCGEGYYLDRLAHALTINGGDFYLSGFDISKWAVRKAAILNKTIQWFVADVNQRLLFPDEAVTLLLDIFAPRNAPEFERVLTPGGMLFCIIPSDKHLAVLRGILGVMDIEPEKLERTISKLAPPLHLLDTVEVEYDLMIEDPDHIDQLVQMTPFSRHLTEDKWASIRALSALRDRFSCTILILEKP